MHYNRFKTFKMLNFTDQTLFQVHVGLVNALSIVAHIVRNTFGGLLSCAVHYLTL